MNTKTLPFDEVLEAWNDDKHGEYIAIGEDGIARYMSSGTVTETIPTLFKDNVFADIRHWMTENQYWPNIWSGNDHGNVTLHDAQGNVLGGIV